MTLKLVMAKKYQEYFQKMVQANSGLFETFKRLHDKYAADPDRLQEAFNTQGEQVLTIIRQWEGKLCSQSEKAGYGTFTGNLAEKFHVEVKKMFPLIDHVGIIAEEAGVNHKSPFTLKKIKLL